MSRYWDWQLGERAMVSHLRQRNVIPPSGSKQRNFFMQKTTERFCKAKQFTGSYTERIMFICYQNNGANWKEFCQWTKTLMKMPLFQRGDQLTFLDNVIVEVRDATPAEEPKHITVQPLDPEVNIGQGFGRPQTYRLKNLPSVKNHYRPNIQ